MRQGVIERLATLSPSEESRVGYLLRLSRPRFWLYLAGPVVVGVVYAADATTELVTPATLAIFAYFLVPANLVLYGLNDIFDADVDRYNPKKSAEGKEVRYRGDGLVVAVVLAMASLGIALLAVLPFEGILAVAGFFLLASQYSAPPLRLKTTPLLDSLSNGLYILPAIVAYVTVAGSLPPVLAIAAGWLWAMAMHTFSAIPDIGPDRDAGIRTTATWLGAGGALTYCAAAWLGAAGLMALVHPALGGLFAIYPLFVAGVAVTDVAIERAYWWFPILNTLAGTALTMAGLWVMLYG